MWRRSTGRSVKRRLVTGCRPFEVILDIRQILGAGQIGRHRRLMLDARILVLERGDHREDRHALLKRLRAPRREGAAVVDAVDRERDALGRSRRAAGSSRASSARRAHRSACAARRRSTVRAPARRRSRPSGMDCETPVKMSSVVRASDPARSSTASIEATGSASGTTSSGALLVGVGHGVSVSRGAADGGRGVRLVV